MGEGEGGEIGVVGALEAEGGGGPPDNVVGDLGVCVRGTSTLAEDGHHALGDAAALLVEAWEEGWDGSGSLGGSASRRAGLSLAGVRVQEELLDGGWRGVEGGPDLLHDGFVGVDADDEGDEGLFGGGSLDLEFVGEAGGGAGGGLCRGWIGDESDDVEAEEELFCGEFGECRVGIL